MTDKNWDLEIQGSPPPEKPAWEGNVPSPPVPYSAPEAHAPLPADSDWGWDFTHHVLARGQRITLAVTAPAGWSITALDLTLDGQRGVPESFAAGTSSVKLARLLDSYSPGTRHRAAVLARARRDSQEVSRAWFEEWID
jgi:hypothetical protein